MKKSLFTLFMLMLIGSVVYAQTVPVTISVKMGAKVFNKLWDPAKDSVTIRGDFQMDAGDVANWSGFAFKMSGSLVDTIYSVTLNLPAAKVGTEYQYKYVIGPDSWEGADNRKFTLTSTALVVPANWYNNDSTHNSKPVVTNTYNFTADISGILGNGDGYFDPSIDSLQVVGLDWDGFGTVVSGNRTTVADPLIVGQYTATMTVKGVLGDSCKWKFKGYPDARFSNTGYETGGDRWLQFVADGSIVDVGTIIPRITPNQPALTADVVTLFECDLNGTPAPVNAKNNRAIPLDSIIWIGIKGGNAPLGSWGGSWLPADIITPNATMTQMFDDGTNGDVKANDKVYSTKVTFPIGTPGGAVEFKFGANYPAASADAGGTTPLDNEGAFGFNHVFMLKNGTPTHIRYHFGNFTETAVKDLKSANVTKFELNQNYPNPFNPTTKITFSVPVDGNVVMKIYNVMGQEVATLVNEYVKAGAKEATFNASNMPSGMYIYSIKAGNFSATKKMMLLK